MTFNILDATNGTVLATSSLEPTSTTPTAAYSGSIAAFNQGKNKSVKFQLEAASNSTSSAFCGMTEASFTYTEGSDGGDDPVLSSISISGSMTKTSYTTEESWDPTGLTVTGSYTPSGTADLTSKHRYNK